MPVVAVAGGSGRLGSTIVEAIVKEGGHDVIVLTRVHDKEKEKELGVRMLVVNYRNTVKLSKTLETNQIDTIIAALDSPAGEEAELALIKAADASSITKRFIPSWWAIKYTPEVAKIFPDAQSKIKIIKALERTSLEYTTVMNGLFLDYFTPKTPSSMGPFAMVLDIPNNAAAIPGSGDVPITFTHTSDVARFVASLLNSPKWQNESFVMGGRLTWNQFLALVEEIKGVKFRVEHDHLNKLENGKVTELPAHREMYAYFPKQNLQEYIAMFGIMFENGFFGIQGNATIAGFEARGVRDLLEESWKTSEDTSASSP